MVEQKRYFNLGTASQILKIKIALLIILTSGGSGNFAIFNANETKNYYVQVAAERGGDGLYMEAASNICIPEKNLLSTIEIEKLHSLGWQDPDDQIPNFHQCYDYLLKEDLLRASICLVDTLQQVYSLNPNDDIKIEIELRDEITEEQFHEWLKDEKDS
jgi:hypothetical protein